MQNNNDKKSIYLTLYAVATVFLLAAFAITILHSPADKNENNTAPVDKSNVKPISEITTESAVNITKETTTTTEMTTSVKAENNVPDHLSEQADISLFDDNDEMAWPVAGQIIMDYNTETAIYDKTLDQYRTNSSICIAAPLGEEVCASADGVVTAISKDDVKGITVAVDHGNGWLTTYSQLQDNLTVSEGQTVHKGDKLGSIGEPSKYGVGLGSHLEFSVYKGDESTDPKLVLASLE